MAQVLAAPNLPIDVSQDALAFEENVRLFPCAKALFQPTAFASDRALNYATALPAEAFLRAGSHIAAGEETALRQFLTIRPFSSSRM